MIDNLLSVATSFVPSFVGSAMAQTVLTPPSNGGAWGFAVSVASIMALPSFALNFYLYYYNRQLKLVDTARGEAVAEFTVNVEPLIKNAHDAVELLATQITKANYEKKATKRLKDLQKCQDAILPSVMNAYRFCNEADQFLRQGGVQSSSFESTLWYIDDDNKLDDFLAISTQSLIDSNAGHATYTPLKNITDLLSRNKVKLRKEMALRRREFIKEFIKAHKNPNR